MEVPKFKNRPNYHLRYNYNDGRGLKIDQDFWISRSVAVVGVVFADTVDGLKVLIAKRSQKMLDEAGKYGVPCGYLDYNETRHEAMIREVYEETSLYLPDYDKYLFFNNNGDPFKTKDKPSEDKRQNVSHIYLSAFDFSKEPDMFPQSIESFTNKETTTVNWLKLVDFYETYNQYQWAFHHDQTIKDAINFFNKNFNK